MAIKQLTKEEFIRQIADLNGNTEHWNYRGSRPAVIDFFAEWCGPCKALAPLLEEIAAEFAGKVDFYKVDIDRQSDLAAAFGIRSVPTLLFIPMNEKPRRTVGVLPKASLREAVEEILPVTVG